MVAEVSLTDLLIEALAAEARLTDLVNDLVVEVKMPDLMIDWPETDLVESLTDPIIKGVDGEVRLTTLMIRVGCGGSKVDWPDDWVGSRREGKVD